MKANNKKIVKDIIDQHIIQSELLFDFDETKVLRYLCEDLGLAALEMNELLKKEGIKYEFKL